MWILGKLLVVFTQREFMENYEILWNSIQIINLMKMSSKNFRCAVEHEGKLSKWFPVMSGFLFALVIDWIMRKTTRRKRGIQLGLDTMEDLDFADDLAVINIKKKLEQKKNELENWITHKHSQNESDEDQD